MNYYAGQLAVHVLKRVRSTVIESHPEVVSDINRVIDLLDNSKSCESDSNIERRIAQIEAALESRETWEMEQRERGES